MLKRVLAIAAVLFGIVAVGLGAAPASATNTLPTHINGCTVTTGGDLTISTKVVNDPDSGAHGNWAMDNFTRVTSFHKDGDVWRVTITDNGSFTTDPDALSPNNGSKLPHKGVTGSFVGQAYFTVNTTNLPSCKDLPNTINGAPGTSTWPERFFCKGTTYTMGGWSWTYRLNCYGLGLVGIGNVSWVDSSEGLTGDISLGSWVRLCHKKPCPSPSSVSPTPASPTPSPASPSPAPSTSSPSASASSSSSTSSSPTPVALVNNSSSLPVTGTSLTWVLALGLGLIVIGGGGILGAKLRYAKNSK